MNLETTHYAEQARNWPATGRCILANYDEDTILVYQAYRPEIAEFALANGYFGGAFSYSRMSWIKTNFLWMMYRSGWGTKEGQEYTLGVRLTRRFFDEILAQAVPSIFVPELYTSRAQWEESVADSDVRLQWDPDHDPQGRRLDRRSVQLGLRGEALRRYGTEEVREVIDLSEFVRRQRTNVDPAMVHRLQTPREDVYVPGSREVSLRLGLAV